MRHHRLLSDCAVLSICLALPAVADNGPNHRVSSDFYGVSGSNVNHISRAFCCGGTLGSLVTDGATDYILSNNHILARTDAASAGEDITQPGLIDNRCDPAEIVADFTVAPPLGSNVDAAIAALRPGAMSAGGEILDIGAISSTIRSASVGLPVAKSGRTTGFTTATIGAVNASVTVLYQKDCGVGRLFFVSYTNQLVVNSPSFSAGGDSGSLVVTNDRCDQPVGLLYAGSSTTTILNPIGEVLDKVGAALGAPLSFVGRRCAVRSSGSSATGSPLELPAEAAEQAKVAFDRHIDRLMALPSVVGVGIGASPANPFEATIVVYVDHTAGAVPELPAFLDGVSVTRILTDPFVAY